MRLPAGGVERQRRGRPGGPARPRGRVRPPRCAPLPKKPAPAAKASRSMCADAGEDKFNLTVKRGGAEEKYEGLSLSAAKGAQNVVETVNKDSKLVMLEEVRVAGVRHGRPRARPRQLRPQGGRGRR